MTARAAPLLDNVRSLVSHDLRNPLSAAWTTAAFMAEMDGGEDVLTTRNIHTIQSALGRAITWIDDLVTTVELETGTREPELIQTDTGMLFEAARQRQRSGFEATWPDGEPVGLRCDDTLLVRAITALVANADRHGRNQAVVVGLSRNGDDLTIDVSDEGPGVPPHRRDDLFVPLSDPGRSDREIGGLGLACCAAAVRAHGGTVGFAPRQPRGSRFWLQVPRGP